MVEIYMIPADNGIAEQANFIMSLRNGKLQIVDELSANAGERWKYK